MSMWYATVGAGDTKRQRERQREWQIINTCNLNDAVKESGDNCRENKLQRNIRMCSRHCRIMNTVNIHSIAPFLGGLFVHILLWPSVQDKQTKQTESCTKIVLIRSFIYASWESGRAARTLSLLFDGRMIRGKETLCISSRVVVVGQSRNLGRQLGTRHLFNHSVCAFASLTIWFASRSG